MRSSRRLALGASILATVALVGTAGGGAIVSAQDDPVFIVGTDGWYEAALVGEIYAQALEAGGYTVDRSGLAIGARPARIAAYDAGQVNIMPEYLGFGLTFFTAAEDADEEIAAVEATGDIATDSASLEQIFELRGVPSTVLRASAGEDINTAVVRPDTAEEFGLSTMSDLAAAQDDLRFGLPPDCETNVAGCKGALEDGYGITWPPTNLELIPPCGAEMALALEGNAIDVAWLCSTQPDSAVNGWVVLEDDQETQPLGNIVPIVRNDVLEQVDGGAEAIAAILDPVSAALTDEAITELLVRVAVDQEDHDVVAAEFLAGLEG
jgi:osmoprotectant transport system substrate-binding protein